MHTEDHGHTDDNHGELPQNEIPESAFHRGEDHVFDSHEAAPALDLGDDERLPWLEGADDLEDQQRNRGGHRLIALGVVALIVLGLLVNGIYWVTHRGGSSKPADGSLIEASKDPYKVAPEDPGGKKFAGTGDSSFKVSQGQHPDASLAGSAGTTPPPAAATPTAMPSTPAPVAKAPEPAPDKAEGGGVAVQVGAYSTEALAQSAWTRLTAANDLLKGVNHRVVEGKADIGTVYRLQAMTSDGSAANSLCSHLQADGVKCQVKR